MYNPKHFTQDDLTSLQAMVAEHPLAIVVSTSTEGLDANHLPLLWQDNRLIGHIAKANPLWKVLEDGAPVLAIFSGEQGYISPSFYPSKKRDGKAVPTWNYQAVHLHGRIRFLHEAEEKLAIVTHLTQQHESVRTSPWQVNDAPTEYLQNMLKAIVGIEIEIERIEGKFKLSQNQNAENTDGVIQHLSASDDAEARKLGAKVLANNPAQPE